jgi:hypothetical protein
MKKGGEEVLFSWLARSVRARPMPFPFRARRIRYQLLRPTRANRVHGGAVVRSVSLWAGELEGSVTNEKLMRALT